MTTGLLLIDIQNDYFPGSPMELSGINEASSKAKELLSFFRKRQWPTIHIQHIIPNKAAPVFRPNTRGVEIHDRVTPLPGERVIQKHYPNSFRETPLLQELKSAGVERVVICGAMSHMCIDATTRAAADFEFSCVVIHDACATKDLDFGGRTLRAEDVHGSFMAALGASYAKVQNLDQFISSVTDE